MCHAEPARRTRSDRGDPNSTFVSEPGPNGGYANLGAFGGTSYAALSPAQYVLVTDPQSRVSVQPGDTLTVNWRSAGLSGNVSVMVENTAAGTVFLAVDNGVAGGGAVLNGNSAKTCAISRKCANRKSPISSACKPINNDFKPIKT